MTEIAASVATVSASTAVLGRRRPDRVFYTGISLAAGAAVFTGFARSYYLRPQFQSSPLPWYLHLHGAVFTAWMVLFIVQTWLVSNRRLDLHRRLGVGGAILAASMVPVALTAAVIRGRLNVAAGLVDQSLSFFATPVMAILVFASLVSAAVVYRRQPEMHKRLMLLATISILDAGVARWPLQMIAGSSWLYFVVTDLFIVAGIAYDLATRGRVHSAYLWGGLLVVAEQATRDAIGTTAWWHAFASLILQ